MSNCYHSPPCNATSSNSGCASTIHPCAHASPLCAHKYFLRAKVFFLRAREAISIASFVPSSSRNDAMNYTPRLRSAVMAALASSYEARTNCSAITASGVLAAAAVTDIPCTRAPARIAVLALSACAAIAACSVADSFTSRWHAHCQSLWHFGGFIFECISHVLARCVVFHIERELTYTMLSPH